VNEFRTSTHSTSVSPSFACLIICLASAGWACSGVSEETRQQAQTDVNLGRGLYADEHDVRGAIVAWERAIRRDPENAEAHLYLGQVYGQQNLNDRAEPLLRRAVALYERQAVDDERQRAPLAESRNSLAVVLTNMGRHDEAIALLRQVTQEITYGSPHLAWGNLGLALLRKGQAQEAVTALQRAVAQQPNFCVGNARLGEAYYRLNDFGHALEAFDHALSTQQAGCDRIQSAYLNRARVRIQLHQAEQARADLTRCIELDATTPEGAECAQLGRSVVAP